MAAIDKIYGTREQAKELKLWLNANKPAFCRSLYNPDDMMKESKIIPMSNFSIEEDKWLLENCPLDFVVNQIKEQYGIYKPKGGEDG